MGRRGPPKLKGTPTSIRFEPELKAKLEESAKLAGRSFAEEVSVRLKASLHSVEFAVPETKGLAHVIALALALEEAKTGSHWFQNAWAFRRAWFAINKALLYFRPHGDPFLVPDEAKQLRRLRLDGFEALIPKAVEELRTSRSAKISGQMAVAIFEKVAGGRRSVIDDDLEPVAHVVNDMLVKLDNDTAALKEMAASIMANLQMNAGSAAISALLGAADKDSDRSTGRREK